MFKTLMAATAALTLMSGVVLAQDTSTETTRHSTGIGPLKFETDRTVRHDSTDGMIAADRDRTVEKDKTVTHDVDGDRVSKSKSETTTVR
jgi:hypothetical protein